MNGMVSFKKPKRRHPERDLQIACVEWFKIQYNNKEIRINHSPNENKGGGSTISGINYNKTLTKMGRIKGFLDIQILYKGKSLFIEMKAPKGIVSKEQMELLTWLNENDFEAYIVNNIYDFKDIVEKWIKICDGKK